MTATEREEVRTAIQEAIKKASEDLSAQQADNKSIAPDRAIGRVSRMDAMYNQQVNAGTLKRTKERLAKLEYVLGRIDNPDFGQCEYCRSPIHLARLKAMPESTTCVRCASFAG